MQPSSVLPFYFGSSEIRTISVNDQPWFVAKDVCDALGLENVTNALQRVPEKHLALYRIKGKRGDYEVNTIDEPGLYRLILRSDKPKAEPFMEWVTAEMLPTIRRTGSFVIQPDDKSSFINQSRAIPSSGGMDLLYSLDLTKFILRPNKTTIALLERITGIQLSDIPLDGNFDKDSPINSFISRKCRQADKEKNRIKIKDVYNQFVAFFRAEKNSLRGLPPIRELSIELHRQGFEGRKVGGVAWIYGLKLTAEA